MPLMTPLLGTGLSGFAIGKMNTAPSAMGLLALLTIGIVIVLGAQARTQKAITNDSEA